MAIGIIVWGGLDVTIAVPLFLCAAGLIGLLVALVAVASEKKVFAWIAGLSSFAIFCVTLLFLIEFLFFRAANANLVDTVPVFGANIPLIALYVFSLTTSFIEILISTSRIQRSKAPEAILWPQ
jgi:hypothetical protein